MLRRQMTRREELENADQVVGAVFDRRAGECPTPAPADRAHHLAGGLARFLIRCDFVENHQVELEAASASSSRSRCNSS